MARWLSVKLCEHPRQFQDEASSFAFFSWNLSNPAAVPNAAARRRYPIVAPFELQKRDGISARTTKILSVLISQLCATRSVNAATRGFRFESGTPMLLNSRNAVGLSSPANLIRAAGTKLAMTLFSGLSNCDATIFDAASRSAVCCSSRSLLFV